MAEPYDRPIKRLNAAPGQRRVPGSTWLISDWEQAEVDKLVDARLKAELHRAPSPVLPVSRGFLDHEQPWDQQRLQQLYKYSSPLDVGQHIKQRQLRDKETVRRAGNLSIKELAQGLSADTFTERQAAQLQLQGLGAGLFGQIDTRDKAWGNLGHQGQIGMSAVRNNRGLPPRMSDDQVLMHGSMPSRPPLPRQAEEFPGLFDWQKKINNSRGEAHLNPNSWGVRGRNKNADDAELLARLEWQNEQTPGWSEGPDYKKRQEYAANLGYDKFQWYKNMVQNQTDPLGRNQSALGQHYYDTVSVPSREQFGPHLPWHNPGEWKKQQAAEDAFRDWIFQKITR